MREKVAAIAASCRRTSRIRRSSASTCGAADHGLRGGVESPRRTSPGVESKTSQAAHRADRRRGGGRSQRRRDARDPGEPRSAPARGAHAAVTGWPRSPPPTSTCRAARSSATAADLACAPRASSRPSRDPERHPPLDAGRRCDSDVGTSRTATRTDIHDAVNGADAVSFAVRKQSGANTVEITDASTRAGARASRRTSRPADPADPQRRGLHQRERDEVRIIIFFGGDGVLDHLRLHARLALDADLRAGAADVRHGDLLLHVTWPASRST